MLFDQSELKKDLENLATYFAGAMKKISSGKVNLPAIEGVMVDAYGSNVELRTIGQIQPEDAVNVKIVVWDKNVLPNAESALREANLGASVSVDKDSLRLKFNPITEEDRKARVKELNQLLEETRIKIRHARQEIKKKLDALTGVSEDDQKRSEQELQKMIDESIKAVEEMSQKKEEDLMRV